MNIWRRGREKSATPIIEIAFVVDGVSIRYCCHSISFSGYFLNSSYPRRSHLRSSNRGRKSCFCEAISYQDISTRHRHKDIHHRTLITCPTTIESISHSHRNTSTDESTFSNKLYTFLFTLEAPSKSTGPGQFRLEYLRSLYTLELPERRMVDNMEN
jgi:hypothetical protein